MEGFVITAILTWSSILPPLMMVFMLAQCAGCGKKKKKQLKRANKAKGAGDLATARQAKIPSKTPQKAKPPPAPVPAAPMAPDQMMPPYMGGMMLPVNQYGQPTYFMVPATQTMMSPAPMQPMMPLPGPGQTTMSQAPMQPMMSPSGQMTTPQAPMQPMMSPSGQMTTPQAPMQEQQSVKAMQASLLSNPAPRANVPAESSKRNEMKEVDHEREAILEREAVGIKEGMADDSGAYETLADLDAVNLFENKG